MEGADRADLARLGEVVRIADAPHGSLRALLDALERWPALGREIARIGDSDLYGMEGRITGLRRAVLVLGARTVARIAATLVVRGRVEAAPDGPRRFAHALEIGLAAEALAADLELTCEFEGYLAGVLHVLPGTARLVPDRGAAALVAGAHALAAPDGPGIGLADVAPNLTATDRSALGCRVQARLKHLLAVYC